MVVKDFVLRYVTCHLIGFCIACPALLILCLYMGWPYSPYIGLFSVGFGAFVATILFAKDHKRGAEKKEARIFSVLSVLSTTAILLLFWLAGGDAPQIRPTIISAFLVPVETLYSFSGKRSEALELTLMVMVPIALLVYYFMATECFHRVSEIYCLAKDFEDEIKAGKSKKDIP